MKINKIIKRIFSKKSVKNIRHTHDILSKGYVFDNQIHTAFKIIENFKLGFRWNLLFAEMQSGKSGTFFSVPYIISRNIEINKKLNIDTYNNNINVFLLTGMNEIELIEQFESDIEAFTGMDIKKNILHNSEMQYFLKTNSEIWTQGDLNIINKMKKNSLILIDESHYGSDKGQTLNKFLTSILGISPNGDNKYLLENNIYVVSISATPMAEFIEASSSEFDKKIVSLENSDGYYGVCDMYNSGNLYDAYDFTHDDDINMFIDTVNSIKEDGYILIRCTNMKKMNLINAINGIIPFIDYDQESKKNILNGQSINDILDKKINYKKIIFLKNMLRAGKRVNTKNVIMTHDTPKSNTDTTVQGLLGRCCGYNKNKKIKIYCDLSSVIKYKEWIESDYDLNMVPNKSKNVNGKNNGLSIEVSNKPIVFDIDEINNDELNSILNIGRKKIYHKVRVLELLGCDIIDNILKNNNYEIGSLYNVDKLERKTTTYKKLYEEVIKYEMFMTDYHLKETDLDKDIFGMVFEKNNNKLLISFGKVVQNTSYVSEKSMYHYSNNL